MGSHPSVMEKRMMPSMPRTKLGMALGPARAMAASPGSSSSNENTPRDTISSSGMAHRKRRQIIPESYSRSAGMSGVGREVLDVHDRRSAAHQAAFELHAGRLVF